MSRQRVVAEHIALADASTQATCKQECCGFMRILVHVMVTGLKVIGLAYLSFMLALSRKDAFFLSKYAAESHCLEGCSALAYLLSVYMSSWRLPAHSVVFIPPSST